MKTLHTGGLRDLVRAFVSVSALYALGVPLALVANVVLARTLSVSDFGAFGFALSVATVLAVPVAGGIPILLTREIASYSSTRDWSSFRGILTAALAWVIGISVLIGMGAGILHIIGAGPGASALLFIAMFVPLLGLNAIRTGILTGLGHPAMAEISNRLIQPILLIAGYMLLAHWQRSSIDTVMGWYFSASVVTLIFATFLLWRVNPLPSLTIPRYSELPRWGRSYVNLTLVAGGATLSTQLAVLLTGILSRPEEVAVLRVAEQGAQLVVFPLMFINAAVGPYVVRELKDGDRSGLQHLSRFSARLVVAVALPIAIVLLFFGRELLALAFGSPYGDGAYLPMMVLIGGHLASTLLGNSGFLLTMSGYERFTLFSSVLSVAVILALSVVLIPLSGSFGAAMAASGGIITSKLFLFWVTKWKLGIWPGPF